VNISDESESGSDHNLEIGLVLDRFNCTDEELAELGADLFQDEVRSCCAVLFGMWREY